MNIHSSPLFGRHHTHLSCYWQWQWMGIEANDRGDMAKLKSLPLNEYFILITGSVASIKQGGGQGHKVR